MRAGEEEPEVGAAAQQGPGPLNLEGQAVHPPEAIEWELRGAQADRAYLWLQRRSGRIHRLHLARGVSSSRIFLAPGSPPF